MNARLLRFYLILALGAWLLGGGAAYAGAATAEAMPNSVSALYNAGNSYAREGRPGAAILDYERALILSPNDHDIEANLAHVRAASGLATDPGPWFERHARIANPNVLYGLGLIGLVMLGTSVLVIRFSSPQRHLGWSGAVLGTTFFGVALCDAFATWPVMHEAVALHATAARVSPVAGGDRLFMIPEGQMITMEGEYRGLTLVKLDAAHQGWVADADLGPVVPRKTPEQIPT
jgi:tetratricopeptide (TPR) repeat protein